MGKNAKTLIIGLDGVSFNVLTPLMEKGLMPNVKQIMDQGCYGDLLSTVPPFTAPAWASFITGLNPANHGILSFIEDEIDDNSGLSRKRTLKASDIKGEKLWDILSAYKKKIIAINVPFTYAPQAINGVMITGMMTPSQSEDFTYPNHIKDELKDYLIDVTLDKGEDWVVTNETLGAEGIYKKSMDVLKSREKAVLQLMERYDWDFLMVVFTATDRILHFLWEYFAPDQSKFVEEVEAFFQYLDKVIGEIVERLSEDDNLLIISDHGFDKAPQKVINVNSWLRQMKWLQPVSNRSISSAPHRLFQRQAFRSTIKKLMPRKMRNYLRREISGSLKIAIDWSKTKTYYIPMYNCVCGIGINRLGVQENGIVAEKEYEALRDEIINRSLEIVDSDTGQKIVDKALRREDIYSGEFIGKMPDVIIFLKPEYMGSAMLDSKLIGHTQRLKTGDHKAEGIFIFSGPNAQRGCLHGDQSITDIPPTVCCLMGLPINKAYDGKVIEKAIRSEFIEEYPIQHADISTKLAAYKKKRKIINVDEDTETVKERLEALGYL